MTPEKPKPRAGFFRRLIDRLASTRRGLVDKLREVLTGRSRLDEELLEDFEAVLLSSDVGVAATTHILDSLRERVGAKKIEGAEPILAELKAIILETLGEDEYELDFADGPRPFVVLVVGVNGAGKSTTIGKLAAEFGARGAKTLLVAADTFRAAAADQLEIWSERSGADIVRGADGADPAAVTFDGVQKAINEKYDLVFIDTAGRLHTKKHLMAELEKIQRVVRKLLPEAPHETVLVLDATTGQNAIEQARVFNELIAVSALVMTKLDGTAKGGILIALSHLFEMPIVKIGIGEGVEDLADFKPTEFVRALFGEGKLGEDDAPDK